MSESFESYIHGRSKKWGFLSSEADKALPGSEAPAVRVAHRRALWPEVFSLKTVRRMLSTTTVVQSRLASSRWWLLGTILIGQITLAFSMFAVAVALPNIMNALSADVTSIHWVMTGFQIARTVPMPALGWCSSLVGHRNLYIAGLFTTVVATMCCGLAWSLPSLIFFRVLQGLGAAPAQVTGMVILYEAFPTRQRGLILGLLLLAGSLGPTIGPSLGGYLVQEYSWRAMFYLSLPTAVVSLILAPWCCPKSRGHRGQPSTSWGWDAWQYGSLRCWWGFPRDSAKVGTQHTFRPCW